MPSYDYRCPTCGSITNHFSSIKDKPSTIACEQGCASPATSIITGGSVQLSSASKVERLDPKYDKLVDNAMRSNPLSDPSRHLYRRGDPAKGRPD